MVDRGIIKLRTTKSCNLKYSNMNLVIGHVLKDQSIFYHNN